MYSRRTQPARKKALFWTLCSLVGIILVLAILGLTHVIHIFHHQPVATTTGSNSHINYGPPTSAQKQAGEQTKEQNAPGSSTSSSPNSPGANPSTPSVTITIVRLGQISAGQNVNLRTALSNNVSNGQCVAIFTKSGQPAVTQTTGISIDPTYYSCEPIDISADQFSTDGTWNATVYVQQNGSLVSNKATGTVMVER